jgi:sec-independent protein translocase protein TatA
MFEGLFQPSHLLLILVLVLIVVGPGKLPEVGASLGRSLREIKRGMEGDPWAGTACAKCGAELGGAAQSCSRCGHPRGTSSAA